MERMKKMMSSSRPHPQLSNLSQLSRGDVKALEKITLKSKSYYIDLVIQHVFLIQIIYLGFMRMLHNKERMRTSLVFSHTFEFVTQNAPLMMIQFYNNSFLDGKYQVPLDPMCLIFALLNLLSLIVELFFS